MVTQFRRGGRRMLAALLSSVVAVSCAGVPPPTKRPLTEQRPISALLKAAAYPNSETLLVLVTMQHLLATHREWEGYAYFGRLADEQPERRALFRSVQASMQARVANDLPLWKRVAWVEERAACYPGLFLTGNTYHGVALNDCTERGVVLSTRIHRFLRADK